MSEFPDLPFTLREGVNTEKSLLTYLKRPESFLFLQDELRKKVASVPDPVDEKSQQDYQESLLRLWPCILTDALRKLKENDPREYDPKRESLRTFFHSESLGNAENPGILYYITSKLTWCVRPFGLSRS